jgi:hypothetical protein
MNIFIFAMLWHLHEIYAPPPPTIVVPITIEMKYEQNSKDIQWKMTLTSTKSGT